MDRKLFRMQTLSFSGAINTACAAQGSLTQIPDLSKYSLPHFQWYYNLDINSKERVRDFMIQLDKRTRIDPEEITAKAINEGANIIMESIVKEIGRLKPNLAGTLHKMGSARNGLKINQQDELDFTYEMSIETMFGENVKFKHFESEKNRLLIHVDFGDECPDVSKYDWVGFPTDDAELVEFLSINGSKDVDRYKSALCKEGNEYTLNTEAIAYALFIVLNEIVPRIQLPSNWSHCGYNYPLFSGVRLHIPAFQLQFAYQHPDDKTPTFVSFDFAPVLKLPENLRYECSDVVDEYLDRSGFIQFPWQRLERGTFKGGYYSLAEERWLETYSFESIPKVVIRVCKALIDMLKLSPPKYVTKLIAERIIKHRQLEGEERKNNIEMNTFMMSMLFHLPEVSTIPSFSEFATLPDVYENVGCHEYIPSYVFKKMVMTLMALDENKGRQWMESDIPDLVVTVFMVINDIIISVNQATLLMGSPTETEENVFTYPIGTRSNLCPPLTSRSESGDLLFLREVLEIPLDQFLPQDETVLFRRIDKMAREQSETFLYSVLHEAVKKGNCDELARLFL